MGQPVAVVVKPSSRAGIVRLEANRSLTGMGHERYRDPTKVTGATPGAELARRLFATGQVDGVHVYGNMVTVDLAKGRTAEGLDAVLADLYTYYTPGFVPPPLELPAEEPAPAAAEGAGADTGVAAPADAAASAASAAASLVPAHLLERSRAAKERWFANQGG